MRTIWKFEVEPSRAVIEMPAGANIVHVDYQTGYEDMQHLCVWAIVDTDASKVTRTFHPVLTGEAMPDIELAFVSSAQSKYGFMAHVFEEVE